MTVTILFLLSYALYIFNIGEIFGVTSANVVEKAAFLVTGIACLTLRKADTFVMTLLLLTIAECLGLAAFTTYPDFSWGILLLALNQIVIIYALMAFEPTDRDRFGIMTVVSLMPLASVMLGAAYQLIGKQPLFGVDNLAGAVRLQGSLIPAFLGGLALCGVQAALQAAIATRRIGFTLLFAINLVILVMTGARTALAVGLMITVLSILLSPELTPRIKLLGSLFGALGLGLGAVVFGPAVAMRFEQSGDSGRSLVWDYILALANHYPWTGIGFGHQFYSTPHEVKIQFGAFAAHNDYYRLLLELGRIGMPLFYTLLTMAVLHVWNSPAVRRDPVLLIAYLGYLALSWTDNVLATPPYFPLIIVAIIAAKGRSGAARAAPAQASSGQAPSAQTASAQAPLEPGIRILRTRQPARLLAEATLVARDAVRPR